MVESSNLKIGNGLTHLLRKQFELGKCVGAKYSREECRKELEKCLDFDKTLLSAMGGTIEDVNSLTDEIKRIEKRLKLLSSAEDKEEKGFGE